MDRISFFDFEKLIIEFSEKNHNPYKKSTVKNLFIKEDRNSKDYDAYSFAFILRNLAYANGRKVDEMVYAEAVMQTVKSYSSSKETAIDLMKRFTAYIERNAGIVFQVDFPPISVNSTFERLMYISKYLQDPDAEISKLQDILWLSERTIDDDIAKLRGMDDDPIQICGRKYILSDLTRENDRIRDMASTPHPFFLTCNLTQVIVMLKGLKSMAGSENMYGYAMKTAGEIWEQLSDRAKARISFVTSELMPDDKEWFESLGNMGKNTFWPEHSCSTYSKDCILECLKNRKPCYFEYESEEGIKLIKVERILKWSGDTLTAICEGKQIVIDISRILRSAKTKEEIF